jgi:hypothetical protein
MPYQARIDTPGALHLVICRGIGRRNIFRDNTDRNRFLERLGSVLQKTMLTPVTALSRKNGKILGKILIRCCDSLVKADMRRKKIPGLCGERHWLRTKSGDDRRRTIKEYRWLGCIKIDAKTEVGTYLGLSKSATSRAATRGQKLIADQSLSLKG